MVSSAVLPSGQCHSIRQFPCCVTGLIQAGCVLAVKPKICIERSSSKTRTQKSAGQILGLTPADLIKSLRDLISGALRAGFCYCKIRVKGECLMHPAQERGAPRACAGPLEIAKRFQGRSPRHTPHVSGGGTPPRSRGPRGKPHTNC